MNSTAYGERNVITAGTETREISGGRWPTTTVSPAISRKVKSRGDAVGEVGLGHISMDGRDNTTRSEERTSGAKVPRTGEAG
jgi:hypothetical protein